MRVYDPECYLKRDLRIDKYYLICEHAFKFGDEIHAPAVVVHKETPGAEFVRDYNYIVYVAEGTEERELRQVAEAAAKEADMPPEEILEALKEAIAENTCIEIDAGSIIVNEDEVEQCQNECYTKCFEKCWQKCGSDMECHDDCMHECEDECEADCPDPIRYDITLYIAGDDFCLQEVLPDEMLIHPDDYYDD